MFRRLEDDPAPGEWHGQGGPLHVHRFASGEMRPVHRAFLEACAELGHSLVDDHNAPGALGAAFYIPTVLVPPLLVTHFLMFRLLLRAQGLGETSLRGATTPESLPN